MSVLHVVGLVVAVVAQGAGRPPERQRQPPDEESAVAQINRLTGELKRLGEWEAQYEIIDRAMDGLWSRNQWNSEADLYAREMIDEVARIPPWEFDRRMDTLARRIGDRYGLSPQQQDGFKSRMYRETFGLIWNHAPVLLGQMKEYVDLRVRGEPLTPEKVARWTRESGDLMADWRQRSDRLVESLGREVDDRHRARFEEDVRAFQRRMAAVEQMRSSWAEGGWKPEDWGLEYDPVQLEAELQAQAPGFSPAERAAAERLRRPIRPHAAHDPATWEDYVRGFIALYALDAGQVAAAESILVEVLARAVDYLRYHAVELARVPRHERDAHEQYAPLRALFEELKARLAGIPTEAQKRAALKPAGSE